MKTVREQIISRIISQLETITLSNGYLNEIGGGHVYRCIPIIEQNITPAIAVWELAEKRERNTYGGTIRTLLIKIEAMVDTNGDQHPAESANALLGDIEKSLMLSNTEIDGLIDDIQDVAAELIPLPLEQQLAAASIEFEIQYTTEWGNPYQLHH
ncbi:hypothetical protein [Candidatus Venteria ishoeyi]|uniref:Uncharacterized protein n=1 Tax=Candidatus Venteria ishoeyi TaxID=1899563 RepID=A0A1H6FGA4_9GAMM|nr:hypothetical protein [Candidatus Venteria ishoeyi]MDM8546849.1 hypothetical protein [Candidatus Venteria ishoeyi]SEH08441.1 Uncharacterised protein [Candidatus Venteria ishoeyi]